MTTSTPPIFTDWLSQLEARHLADLRVPEVTRALRALSSSYVERRQKIATGSTLDTAGKRAAFALFYAPLHFLATWHVARLLGSTPETPFSILDLGCGTGAAGAAWALATGASAVVGIDRHPWAIGEARWTYRQLGINGQARQGDLVRAVWPRAGSAVLAAYALNELPDASRLRIEDRIIQGAAAGVRALVLEPIARTAVPWWNAFAERVVRAGGRVDEWKIPVDLPPLVRLLDRAAGLDHREIKLRSAFLPSAS